MRVEVDAPTTGGRRRGCGTRVRGGFYLEVPLSPFGRPIWSFVLDPLLPYKGRPFQGVRFVEAGGRQLLLDWVGERYYPYPADFLAEAGELGISRRVPRTQVHRVRPGALLVFVHRRVLPVVPPDAEPRACLGEVRLGEHAPDRCGGWVRHVPPDDPGGEWRTAPGSEARYGVWAPTVEEWRPGLFAAVPVSRVAYVRGAGEDRDADAAEVLEALRAQGVEAVMVDE